LKDAAIESLTKNTLKYTHLNIQVKNIVWLSTETSMLWTGHRPHFTLPASYFLYFGHNLIRKA